MDKTKDSFRRGWAYALLLVGCIAYGAYPQTEKEAAAAHAREAASQAVEWMKSHVADLRNRNWEY